VQKYSPQVPKPPPTGFDSYMAKHRRKMNVGFATMGLMVVGLIGLCGYMTDSTERFTASIDKVRFFVNNHRIKVKENLKAYSYGQEYEIRGAPFWVAAKDSVQLLNFGTAFEKSVVVTEAKGSIRRAEPESVPLGAQVIGLKEGEVLDLKKEPFTLKSYFKNASAFFVFALAALVVEGVGLAVSIFRSKRMRTGDSSPS
jgi:hypothetical protein